jgi:hypothetical protein
MGKLRYFAVMCFTLTQVGIGTAIRRHVGRFPAIVVFPQCRKNLWWLV